MDQYIYISILSAALYGLGMSIDKLFFTQCPVDYSQETVTLVATVIYGSVGVLILFIFPVNLTPTPTQTAVLGSAGVLFGIGSFLYFYAMKRSSASKVSQLASLEAVTTPIFATVFLQELARVQSLIAICIIILGLFLLVFDRGVAEAVLTTKTAVIPILIAVLLWSIQDVLTKFASQTHSIWTLYFWVRTGSAITLLSLLIKQKYREDIIRLTSNYQTHNTYYLGVSGLITAGGLFLAIVAINSGSLTIVAPLLATYSVFTLLFSFAFTKFTSYKIHGTGESYILKQSISILLFVVGIWLLSTNSVL